MKILKSLNVMSYEPFSFLIGLGFMVIGYLIVKIIDKEFGKKEEDIIKMTRII
jgi:sigma-E factor negative regulatory protein RseC